MKKLFLFAAMLMTGFAFYSCDDVVDNPAQDPAQSWNYSVSVKLADFDFSAQPTDPVTGEPNAYVAPTTLYVLNEQNTLMGTITTDAAPAAGDYATYAGTLTGSIGNNLIITTKIGNDLAKQDGTLASAIKNGIVQTAEVPIKIYNANSGTLTTAAAKLENNTAIAHTASGQIEGGDKIAVVADDQAFEWTVYKEFDPSKSADLYIAIPTNTNPEAEYTISSDSEDGYSRGASFKLADWPALVTGKVSTWLGWLPLNDIGIDLTKWDAYQRETNKATGTLYFNQWINDDQTFIIKQSGEKAINVNVSIGGNATKDVAATLNNIRLEKNNYFEISNGANFAITLIGENKFEMLNLNSPFTKKGDGTWKFNQLNIGGGQYWDGTKDIPYAAEYTINEDIDLKHLSSSNGAKLTIADGKKVNVINEEGLAVSIYEATLNIGKGAILKAESKEKESSVINLNGAELNVGENAEVSAQGAKAGIALTIFNYNYGENKIKSALNIGKNAKVNLVGGPEGILGTGMDIQNSYNATTDITLAEGAILTTIGIDRAGINCYSYNDNNYSGTINFNIAKNAKITAKDIEGGIGLQAQGGDIELNIDGEGTFEAISDSGFGMSLDGWSNYNSPSINFKGGKISATSGADKPAINSYMTLTIDSKIKSFKATKGANATLYISQYGNEANLENLVAEKDKFNDAIADGTRTITPKPAKK
ncbi:hypothetical protein [Prevotella sp. MA2016]|uniref:hypothetical protein n=1 Tax=Prevotella sp. MA2016 TaxID=1408310 RepID=UPI000ADEB186|nr:hypothetical protein [Prevotella sp. MA2016]